MGLLGRNPIRSQGRSIQYLEVCKGNSLEVQGLGLCLPTAGGTGSVLGQGTMIPQVKRPKKITGV